MGDKGWWPNRRGAYEHEVFRLLHSEQGSGLYLLHHRVGFSTVFHLTSAGVIPLNPEDLGPQSSFADHYDILRGVNQGRVTKIHGG